MTIKIPKSRAGTPPAAGITQIIALLVLSLTTVIDALAQAVSPAGVTAAQLAKYDRNNDGRLDAAEQAAMRADEERARNAAGTGTAPLGELVELSPFEVREANNGYYASTTMSGTRLNAKIEDLA